MGRYVSMIDGRTFDQHQPLPVRAGERVRLEFVMAYHEAARMMTVVSYQT